jgi:hypothetical protein
MNADSDAGAKQRLAHHKQGGDHDDHRFTETGYRLRRGDDAGEGQGDHHHERHKIHADTVADEQCDGGGEEGKHKQHLGGHGTAIS